MELELELKMEFKLKLETVFGNCRECGMNFLVFLFPVQRDFFGLFSFSLSEDLHLLKRT